MYSQPKALCASIAASVLLSFSAASSANITSNATHLPPNNKILLVMGQDTTTLRDYKNEVLENDRDMPAPGGVALYTSILPTQLDPNHRAPGDATHYISGIEGNPVDLSNGEANFQETLADYDRINNERGSGEMDKVGLAVGLYLSDSWIGAGNPGHCGNQPLRAIVGTGDSDVGSVNDPSSISSQTRYALDRMILWFKAQERPVYLRFGYEFDGPWNCYGTELFKQAFIYTKDRINALGADNVAMVWQSASYPDNGDTRYNFDPFASPVNPNQTPRAHYNKWYPVRENGADDVVDYIAISYFSGSNYEQHQWSCQNSSQPWTTPEGSPITLYNTLRDMARERGKPLMIAESTPQGFNTADNDFSCTARRTDHLPGNQFSTAQAMWDAWYKEYFQWIEDNRDQLRVVTYINTDWQSQGRWFCPERATSCAAGYWGVTTIQDNPTLLSNFKAATQKSFFINGDSDGGVTPPPPPPVDNQGPIISNCGFTPATINVGESTVFSCQVSDSPEGVAVVSLQANGVNLNEQRLGNATYRWDISTDLLQEGNNPFRITAVDTNGASSNQTATLVVNGNDEPDDQPDEPPVSDCEAFGISYVDDNTLTVYRDNENWDTPANGFQYLCLNSLCYSATLNTDTNRYERSFSGTLGAQYTLEFKLQLNGGTQVLEEKRGVTFTTNRCTLNN